MNQCYHCKKTFSECNLQTVEDKLIHNISKFKNVFKDDPNYDPKATKFCRTCARKWKLLSTKRGKNVDTYISLMKSEMINEKVKSKGKSCETNPSSSKTTNEESSLPSCLENKVEVKINTNEESNVPEDNDAMKNYEDAKKMRDHWYQKWIDGYCSDRVGEKYMKEMAEYARNWKASEKRMEEFKDEYYNETQK